MFGHFYWASDMERTTPPAAGIGRKKGTLNKTTKVLKEAILKAAEVVGEDKKGKDGLVGYLVSVAKTDKKAFCSLLGRVLPLEVVGDPDTPVTVVTRVELIPMKGNDNRSN